MLSIYNKGRSKDGLMSLIKSHKKSLAPNVQFDIGLHVVRKIIMSTFVEPLTCAKGGGKGQGAGGHARPMKKVGKTFGEMSH